VTIEPGLYFNKYNLDTVYLPDPTHSRHIDTGVLKRYMPVGGVRIEDDILITETGYENLTPAVKGEKMLKVIREGAAGEI
jgi:Xaa-Pro dipeptidase